MVSRVKRMFRRNKKAKLPVQSEHYIFLDGDLRTDDFPTAKCTCDWSFGPATLIALGREAGIHRSETGHRLRGVS